MLIGDMDLDKGGINRVMMNRSKLFYEKGYDVTLLTLDFKQNYEEIEEALKDKGRLHEDTRILNVHDYYRKKNTMHPKKQQVEYEELAELEEEGYIVQAGSDHARYFKNGQYVKYKKWDTKGDLAFIDYFNENRMRTKREEFHNGSLFRKVTYHLGTGKPAEKLYYTVDGFCYLNKWFNHKTGEQQKVFLFDVQNQSSTLFESNHDFHVSWLNELCIQCAEKPILICDGPGSAPKALDMGPGAAHVILTVHSNHFASPHKPGSPIKANHMELLERYQEADALVLLTEEQKADIVKQYGDHGNIYVIPHSITPMKELQGAEKDKLLISVIARLHEEKGISEAIESFREVADAFPKAKLEIHGSGPEKENLLQQIKDLNLEDNVQIKGYCDKVEWIYERSLAIVLTSKFEGLSLVIIEAMANGVPAISFNIKYGPSDLIEHGIDGYLVEDRNKHELAKYMIHLLQNPDEAISMGRAGQEKVRQQFNESQHFKLWEALFHGLSD